MIDEPCSLGDCVQVETYGEHGVDVYSSRRAYTGVWIDMDEWVDFITRVKAGEFDNLGGNDE